VGRGSTSKKGHRRRQARRLTTPTSPSARIEGDREGGLGPREAKQSGNIRDAQRLRRCAQPHASGFITAMPSQHDRFDTVLRPKTFRTAMYYRLMYRLICTTDVLPIRWGVPMTKESDQGDFLPLLCMQTIDVYGYITPLVAAAKSGVIVSATTPCATWLTKGKWPLDADHPTVGNRIELSHWTSP